MSRLFFFSSFSFTFLNKNFSDLAPQVLPNMVIHVSVVESYNEEMPRKKYGHRSMSRLPLQKGDFFSPENISTKVNTM